MNRTARLCLLFALLAVAIKVYTSNGVSVSSTVEAAAAQAPIQAAVDQPATTDPPQPGIDLAELAAAAIRASAATSTSRPVATTTTAVVRAVPQAATTAVPTSQPTDTLAPVQSAGTSCYRLDVSLGAARLTAYCSGGVVKTMPISSGSGEYYLNPQTGKTDKADTPTGSFAVYYKDPGMVEVPLGWMYNSLYFYEGFAIHGDPLVPSHGCVHVTNDMADWLYPRVYIGTVVNIT